MNQGDIVMSLQPQWHIVMTEDETGYFKALGGRIAQLRKDQGLTQASLAQTLGIAQQALASYEIGRRRVPVSMLADLARSLGVSIEALLGEMVKASAKRGPSSALARQVERIQALPKPRQKFMVQVLESMLAQH